MTTVSYWQDTARADVCYSELPATADLVVIGGGIMGTSSAYFGALAGLKTVLIDQVALAYGATGRNGGFIGHGPADSYLNIREKYGVNTAQSIWNYTYRTRTLVQDVQAREGFDFHHRMPGALGLAISDEEAHYMRASIAAYEGDGGRTGEAVWIDHPDVQAMVNTPISEEIVGAAFRPNTALIHSAKLVYGLGAAAQRHGATLCIGKVHTIMQQGQRVRVNTYTGGIDAGAVIITGNAWSDELVPQLQRVITPVRGQVLTYAPIPRMFDVGMGVSITPTGEYWQQTLDGSILIGGCRADAPDREWNVREDALRDEVQTPLAHVIPRLFPQLTQLSVDRRWAGPMAFTADYLPVIDAAPGLQNAWIAGGFNGSGMGFGLVTGETLIEAVTSGRKPDALAPFALARSGLHPALTSG
jgi:glycine/D-amino acid oxidase-like deaminating enzyme